MALDRRMSGETLPRPVNGGDCLGSIVVKACAHKPEDRFASAEEFRRALEGALHDMGAESCDEQVTPVDAAFRLGNPGDTDKPVKTIPEGTVGPFEGLGPNQADEKEEINKTVGVYSVPAEDGSDNKTISLYDKPVGTMSWELKNEEGVNNAAADRSASIPRRRSNRTAQWSISARKPAPSAKASWTNRPSIWKKISRIRINTAGCSAMFTWPMALFSTFCWSGKATPTRSLIRRMLNMARFSARRKKRPERMKKDCGD